MRSAKFEVKGLKELMKSLEQYPVAVKKQALLPALKEITKRARDEARRLAPRKTGEMRLHIVSVSSRTKTRDEVARSVLVKKVRKVSRKTYAKMIDKGLKVRLRNAKYQDDPAKKVKLDAFYFVFVEHGTKHAKAKPFMRPAVENARQYAPKILSDRIDKVTADFNSGKLANPAQLNIQKNGAG